MNYRRGFLLGKFLPPHAGHKYLCDFAQCQCDELTILVCSIDAEPIPGRLRHEWMRREFPHARVIHCDEDLPQEPADHPDFWNIWREACRRYHPESIDAVFASEAYGQRLAEELGGQFVPVDIARSVVPVSGTALREAPYENWNHLLPPARTWFTRTVALHGPESTGKTTLAVRLAKALGTICVPEFGRLYTEIFGVDCDANDIRQIALGQTAAIAAARPQARGLVISDTDSVMSAVWSDMLAGHRDELFSGEIAVSDFYFLMDIDAPWEDDGTRYFSDSTTRQLFFEKCKKELDQRNLPYQRLSGSWDEKFDQAMESLRERYPLLVPGL